MIGPDPQGLLADVSRETVQALSAYVELVKKWNPVINLVSKSSLADIWQRHVLDSVQISATAPFGVPHWADLGSGGGFPGIVSAILAKGADAKTQFSFIESDQRKAVFLRTAVREFALSATVLTARIEDLPILDANVLTARALAPLTTLLGFSVRHLTSDGVAIFHKGRNADEEIAAARAVWRFDLAATPSKTDPDAQILTISGIQCA